MSVFDKMPSHNGWRFLLDRKNTMASMKLNHCNDNFLLPGFMYNKKSPLRTFVGKPKNWIYSIPENLQVLRKKDVTRLKHPLFTDHWPITLALIIEFDTKKNI